MYPSLNFDLGETADMIREMVRGFAEKKLLQSLKRPITIICSHIIYGRNLVSWVY